jgi:predicted RNase H-like HicB family nuclease
MKTTELLFLVEDDPEGGFCARAVKDGIFAQGETMDELRAAILDAVECHYDNPEDRPAVIRIHYVHDEVLAS